MTATDDRPSIAELQAAARRRTETTTLDDYSRSGRKLIGATPVLLEIAAAALIWSESDDEGRQVELDALLSALRKMRQ